MIQQQIKHDSGTFPVCTNCGHEPRHIRGRGSHSREAFDVRHPTGERHQLECRCGVRTPWLSSLALALNHWRLHFALPDMASARRGNVVRPLLHLHKESR